MTDNNSIVRTDVAVVGAGLAGLTAARLLQRSGLSVVVLDAQPPGCRGRTDDRNGFLFNRGPHALYLGGHAARVLGTLEIRPQGGPPSAGSLSRTSLLGWKGKLAAGRLLAGLPKLRTDGLGAVTFRAWLDEQRLPTDARQLVEAVARVSSYTNAPDIAAADMGGCVGSVWGARGALPCSSLPPGSPRWRRGSRSTS